MMKVMSAVYIYTETFWTYHLYPYALFRTLMQMDI